MKSIRPGSHGKTDGLQDAFGQLLRKGRNVNHGQSPQDGGPTSGSLGVPRRCLPKNQF